MTTTTGEPDPAEGDLKRKTSEATSILPIAAAWLVACAALIIASMRGLQVEAALREVFPQARPDAFKFLDKALAAPLGLIPITWCAFAATACVRRRLDVLAIVFSGPLIALLMTLPVSDLDDLHWFCSSP